MELRDYLRIMRRSWWLIILGISAGFGATLAFSLSQTPEYEAQTRVYVSTDTASSLAELGQGATYTQQVVQSFVEVTTTPRVLQPVIDELGIELSSEQLSRQISVTHQSDTVLMTIAVTDEDPELAADISNAVTESLIETVQEITPETDQGQNPIEVATLETASVPDEPVSPRLPMNLAVGILLGLAAGAAGAALREFLDTRIRGDSDVEELTSSPIIGGIPFDPKSKSRPLVVRGDPASPRAESFRKLRTNLQFLELGQSRRCFVITSSVQGEGKSTTTANLGLTLREAGYDVLVIDADLRRPQLAKYFGLEGAVGLTDVLIGRIEPEHAIQRWGPHELSFLPAGEIPPNPSEVLGSRAMELLLEKVTEEFDVVLIDSPPLLPVTDAAVLSTRVTGAILVIAAGKTHRHEVKGSLEMLHHAGGRLLGVLPTMLPTRGPDADRYQHYGHRYTYGSDRRN